MGYALKILQVALLSLGLALIVRLYHHNYTHMEEANKVNEAVFYILYACIYEHI